MIRCACIALACLAALGGAPALAEEVVMDAARLAHALDRLSNTGRVLYVAAHPDDENTRLLAYLTNARHVNAAYLSMTRGGGGQNLIGREQETLLDVLRTQELLAARQLDGAQQRFTRMRDFGYSKTAAETLSIWGHDEALADVVFALRSFQPDVVVTRFDEQPPNHGHHTASASLAREAFAAAADPTRFPEQLANGLRVWQPKRLVYNLPTWRDIPTPPNALQMDIGGYDPRLGLSYGELSARSRSQHKSQGFGAAAERGALLERFVPVAGEPARADLLDGVEQSWQRYGAPGRAVADALKQARQALHRDHPERAVAGLLAARRALAALPQADPRVTDARREAEQLALHASGLFVRAKASEARCVPGGSVPVAVEVVARRPAAIGLRRIVLPDGSTVSGTAALAAVPAGLGPAQPAAASGAQLAAAPLAAARPALTGLGPVSAPPAVATDASAVTPAPPNAEQAVQPLLPNEKHEWSGALRCPASAPIAGPYWLRTPPLPGQFVVRDVRELADPEGSPPLSTAIELELEGEAIAVSAPVVFSWTDRVHGERERRVIVAPPATVTPSRDAILFPNHKRAQLSLRVRAGAAEVSGRVSLELPAGYTAEPREQPVNLIKTGDEVVVDFTLSVAPGAAAGSAKPVFEQAGQRFSYREDVVDYPHVPMQVVLQPVHVRLTPLKLAAPRGLIGYVEGPGDTIAADLAHVGAQLELLSDAQLLQGELDRFAAIVLGVRAHNTRDVLRAAHPRLMRYVERGGTLVVQYVTRSTLSPLDLPIGPYPFEIGRGRVTDESASVRLLEPAHPILRTPHRIEPADFEGWIQERGLYFADSWNERYTPLLELADPGEAPQRGALLVARHGRGRFVYTGLSFFRQLPAGVPGAYRLLVNALARESEAPP
jgi:LmbE family N-acetylglucosaminyl deacetylase